MRIRNVIPLLLILMVGCASPTNNVTTMTYTSTPMLKPSSTIPATLTPTITPSLAPLPALTFTISPIPTFLPSLTSTRSPLPNWTPLPSLEPTEALLFVLELLQNNAGCQLPCWWGLTPGKTTLTEAQHYLDSFTYSYTLSGNQNDYQVAEYKIPFPVDTGVDRYVFGFRKGILEDIYKIYYNDLTTTYNLVKILNTYGEPDDILISASYEPRYSDYMINLAIFYLQKGILLEYYDSGGRIIGNKKQICPQKSTFPHLSLWYPALNMSLQDAVNRYVDTFNWPPYRSLQDSTGMSIETFYQTFMDVNNNSCLELNIADWPEF